MGKNLAAKARDGRLKALETLSYRHSIETNVTPLLPRSAPMQPQAATNLRDVFRDTSGTEPSHPLASGQ